MKQTPKDKQMTPQDGVKFPGIRRPGGYVTK